MANKTFQSRIVQKHDTKANWDKATNFVPLKGEIIVYDDLNKIKIGDGNTTVVNLSYSTTINYNDLINQPVIPTAISQLEDDTTFIVTMTGQGTTNSPYTVDHSSQEVYTAVTNGKKIYLKDGQILIPIIVAQGGAMAAFCYLSDFNTVKYVLVDTKITRVSTPLQTTKNKTTTIMSSSTDTQYPSAKAVYDYVNNNISSTTIITWSDDGT